MLVWITYLLEWCYFMHRYCSNNCSTVCLILEKYSTAARSNDIICDMSTARNIRTCVCIIYNNLIYKLYNHNDIRADFREEPPQKKKVVYTQKNSIAVRSITICERGKSGWCRCPPERTGGYSSRPPQNPSRGALINLTHIKMLISLTPILWHCSERRENKINEKKKKIRKQKKTTLVYTLFYCSSKAFNLPPPPTVPKRKTRTPTPTINARRPGNL